MTLDAPRIEAIDEIEYRIESIPWRFAIEHGEAIDRHWDKLCAGNPHLFNGAVFLMRESRVETRGDRRILNGAALEVEYKAFLAWRDFGFPDAKISNCFAMAALVSADGAFMLGRMSDRTANAGKIYFPAGTPDQGDVKGEAIDLEGSVLRELLEETGIAPDEVALAPGWSVVVEGPRIACMKLVRSPLVAAELEARVNTFIAREKAPELVGLHAVFSASDLDEARMPAFTLSYLRRALDRNWAQAPVR